MTGRGAISSTRTGSMRIFVTGGTGIVGRALVPLLRDRGHQVLVLTRGQVESGDTGTVHGDLSDRDGVAAVLRRFAPDAAVHLGWEGLPDYSLPQTLRNLDYSLGFLSAAAAAGCQTIVSTGSCWEYSARIGRLDEDSPLAGAQPFHAAKNALRFLGEGIAAAQGARFYWMRLFFVYGPGQRPNSLVPQLVAAAREGRPPQLRAPGNRHDFVFVGDVAAAISAVIEQRPAEAVYNVGSGKPTAVSDVIAAVDQLLGRPPAAASSAVPEQDFWADISRLHAATGWRPAYNLEAGLRETIRAFGAETSSITLTSHSQ